MARRSSGGGQVTVTGYRELQRALKNYAPEARKELNKELKTEAVPVVADAKRNASWSTRIPAALSLSVTQKGVGIRMSRKKAPHGSIYERGPSRHPLFGNRGYWYPVPKRPVIQPAVDQNRTRIVAASEKAMRRAATKVGL